MNKMIIKITVHRLQSLHTGICMQLYSNIGPVDRAPVFGSIYRGRAKQLKKSSLTGFPLKRSMEDLKSLRWH